MNKSEFLNSLEEKLKELPKDEIRKTIDYYDEMIDDRIEDGMTEEEAVKSIGNSGDIALSILLDHEASIPAGTGKGFRDEDRCDDDDDRVESKKREYREKTEYEGGPDNSTEQYYADPKFSEERIREYREAYGDDLYADDYIEDVRQKKQHMSGLKVFLLILLSPFILAAAGVFFGLFVGACGLIFGLLVGFGATIFALVVSGLAAIFYLVINVITGNVPMGLFVLGCGLLMSGIGVLLLPLVRRLFELSMRLLKGLLGMITGIFKRRA